MWCFRVFLSLFTMKRQIIANHNCPFNQRAHASHLVQNERIVWTNGTFHVALIFISGFIITCILLASKTIRTGFVQAQVESIVDSCTAVVNIQLISIGMWQYNNSRILLNLFKISNYEGCWFDTAYLNDTVTVAFNCTRYATLISTVWLNFKKFFF